MAVIDREYHGEKLTCHYFFLYSEPGSAGFIRFKSNPLHALFFMTTGSGHFTGIIVRGRHAPARPGDQDCHEENSGMV
jgi:hypothetical protein